jgi:hypothetical protein
MIYILLAVYILSALLMWRYTHLAFSKNGIFYGVYPGVIDVILTILPIINTWACFVCWIGYYPTKNKEINSSKFFNIK